MIRINNKYYNYKIKFQKTIRKLIIIKKNCKTSKKNTKDNLIILPIKMRNYNKILIKNQIE